MRTALQYLSSLACLPLAALAQENAPAAPEPVAEAPSLTFGGYAFKDSGDAQGEVEISLTLRRADGVEVEPGALCVQVTVFRLTGDLDILPAPEPLTYTWNGGGDAWQGHELPITLTYTAPAPEEAEAAPTQKACYGFTARLLYHGEVVDTLSTTDELLPQDDAGEPAPPEATPEPEPTEEAIIYSDFLRDASQRHD